MRKTKRLKFTEINMTPLIDTSLVLLIIFMLTAPFLDQGNEVNLPVAQGVRFQQKEQPLIIHINKNKEILINNIKVNKDNLEKRISLLLEKRKDKDIFLKADKKLEYGYVSEIVSLIKQGGAQRIGLVTLPPEFKYD